MNVYQLKRVLENCDPGDEVRIILDQHNPIEYGIECCQAVGPQERYEDVEEDGEQEYTEPVVCLVTGTQLGYADRTVAEMAGCAFR